MAARRQHTVLRTTTVMLYYLRASTSSGCRSMARTLRVSWLLLHGPVYEHEHRRGAQHKCLSCRSKILAFPPPDACGAAAAAFWSQQVCWQFGRTRCALEFVSHPPSLLCVASCIHCAFVALSVCLQVCDLHIADVETVTNEVVHTVLS